MLHIIPKNLSQPRGPRFWKFNSSSIESNNYVNKLRENLPLFIDKYLKKQHLSLKWDLIKMEICSFTVKFSKIKAKKWKNKEMFLQNKANNIFKQTEKNPNDKKLLN